MKIFELKIEGMTCSGCEQRLIKNIQKIDGVIKVEANAVSHTMTLQTEDHLEDLTPIRTRISEMGYEVLSISKPKQSDGAASKIKMSSAVQWVGLLSLVIFIWLISPSLGLTRFALPESIGYVSLFIIGLTTSVHCIGMCGGINMSVSLSATQLPSANPSKTLMQANGSYQLGRVISYTLIGGLAGLIGSSFSISPMFKAGVTIFAGVLMMLMGLNLLGLFGALSKYLPKPPSAFIGIRERAKKMGPLAVGLANGLIPCGPLQAMQLYALSTANPVTGALSMFFFSLGTVPAMFGFGILSGTFGKQLKGPILKFSGLLVIFLGLIAMERGLAMSSINMTPDFSQITGSQNQTNVSASDGVVATLKDGYQEVVINVTPRGYEPIIVQKGIPVKWTLRVTAENLTGCNGGIISDDFGIDKTLGVGDNLVEFLPSESGKFRYTCWMGMIKSKIFVVDDLTSVK